MGFVSSILGRSAVGKLFGFVEGVGELLQEDKSGLFSRK